MDTHNCHVTSYGPNRTAEVRALRYIQLFPDTELDYFNNGLDEIQ